MGRRAPQLAPLGGRKTDAEQLEQFAATGMTVKFG